MKYKNLFLAITLLFLYALGGREVYLLAAEVGVGAGAIASSSREQLEREIQARAQDLSTITQEIEKTNQSLKNTKDQRASLQRNLALIERTMGKLNLNIRADELAIQKLQLELEALHLDLQDIQTTVTEKRTGIGELLRAVQKKDNTTLLTIFLQHASLADSILEAETFRMLQNQLTTDVTNLGQLQLVYGQKILQSTQKKDTIGTHEKDLESQKAIMQDQKTERQSLLAQTKNKETLYQQQLLDLQKKQQEIAADIEALDSQLRSKIDPRSLPLSRPGVLAMPVGDKSDITQDYGATAFAQYGYKGKWHNGIDIYTPVGAPVYAVEDGTVAAVGNQDAYCYRGAYGKFVVVNHTNNLSTLSAHLSQYVVQKGQIVKRGQLIGYSGKTGYATGPHLHFTVYAQATFYMGPSKTCGLMPHGGDLNPLNYL